MIAQSGISSLDGDDDFGTGALETTDSAYSWTMVAESAAAATTVSIGETGTTVGAQGAIVGDFGAAPDAAAVTLAEAMMPATSCYCRRA